MLGRLLSFREGLFFEGRLQVYQFLATWPTHPPPAIRISCFRIPKRPGMELLQWRSEWFTARFFETKQHLQADHQIYLNHATSSGENLTSAHSKLFFCSEQLLSHDQSKVMWNLVRRLSEEPRAFSTMFQHGRAEVNTGKRSPYHPWDERHIYLHEWLVLYGKCRWIFYRWMLWDQYLKAST